MKKAVDPKAAMDKAVLGAMRKGKLTRPKDIQKALAEKGVKATVQGISAALWRLGPSGSVVLEAPGFYVKK